MPSAVAKQIKYGRPRRHDWRERLNWWLEEERHMDMAYGNVDCVLSCANAINAMTGHDPASGIRGKYFTEKGANKIIERNGGMATLVTKFLGPQMSSPLLAQTGDIGMISFLVRRDDAIVPDVSVGVVIEEKVWLRAMSGMEPRPRSVVTIAWPVGRDT